MKNWKEIAKEFLPDEFNEFMGFTGSGRRPDSVEFTTIDQDVKRRDLTINALFFDIDAGEVVDLVGGIDDLKKGIIKTVGSPEDRFGEDRLRILRAVRFAGRFGSRLEPEVVRALSKDASLKDISPERIRDEFLKGIKTAKSVTHFLSLLKRFNLFDWVFRGIETVNTDFVEVRDPAVLLAWILRGNGPKVLGKALNKLTFTSKEVKTIMFLISISELTANDMVDNVVSLKKAQKKSGLRDEQIIKFWELLGWGKELLDTFLGFNLSVTGQDAVDRFGPIKGPAVGQAINQMEIENFKKVI